jgi:RNA polymerase primary sigma factor
MALGHLDPRERQVLTYRFGLDGARPLVLKEIGEKLGISRERVRQIEFRAKQRMRRLLSRKRNGRTLPRRPPRAGAGRRSGLAH